MRVAVDVTPLSVPRSGIGNYLRGAVGGLEAAGCDVTLFAVATGAGIATVRSAFAGRDVRTLALPAANVVRRAWSVLRQPMLERFVGSHDAFLLDDWWYPPQRHGLRSTVVHDLVPLRFPEWVGKRTLHGHRASYRNLLPSADVVFTNSRYTRDDVVATLGLDSARLHVAYPGVDERFTPDGPTAGREEPYLLLVGTVEPRKNLGLALEAKRAHPDLPELVIAGGAGWGDVPDLSGVTVLGRVSDEEVVRLLRGAAALVFPSFYEGFGMPVVEAMACGCPVVCSSHPSLDEAAGDATVRFDPHDPAALAAAIGDALGSVDDLRRRGREHAAQFTWTATGAAMLAGYSSA